LIQKKQKIIHPKCFLLHMAFILQIGMPDFGRSLSAAGEENDFPALFAAAGEERAGRAA
jgi:hypothetical protein